jgi:zona occludens toxin (predicted ATPase)
MAIKVVTGIPGSGKSYYAISHLLKYHYVFDDEFHQYNVKDDNTIIVSNMAGLKLPHFTFQAAAKDVGATSIHDFLRIPNIPNATEQECVEQSKVWHFKQKYNAKLVFIFDEIQRQFPVNYKDQDVVFFFDYHRHLGCDIYILSQNWKKVAPGITALCETEYRALPKSKQFGKELNYHVYSGFDKVGSFKLLPNSKVFSLYKSSEVEELKGKEIRPIRKYAAFAVLLAVLTVSCVGFWLTSFGKTSRGKPTHSSEASVGGGIVAPATASPTTPPNRPAPKKTVKKKTRSDMANSPREDLVIVNTGGVWLGEKLYAIQWHGDLIHVDDFPHLFIPSDGKTRVQVLLQGASIAAQ